PHTSRLICPCADKQENNFRNCLLQASGSLHHSFQTVRHTHGADVTNHEFVFDTQCFPQISCGMRAKQVLLNTVLNDKDLLGRHMPVVDQVILEGRSHDYYSITVAI